jgi:hypothetical protein
LFPLKQPHIVLKDSQQSQHRGKQEGHGRTRKDACQHSRTTAGSVRLAAAMSSKNMEKWTAAIKYSYNQRVTMTSTSGDGYARAST